MSFLLFLCRKVLFGSQATQCPKGSDSCCLQAALAFICLMTSLGRPLCRFAASARRKWRKVFSCSIDHCSKYSLCCWARCCMLPDIDNMEASCVLYVKVSTFTHLEQSKTSLQTDNESGIVRLNVPMTWLLASVTCIIPGSLWDKHQQMSFPSDNVLYIADNHAIAAVEHHNVSLLTYKQQRTDILHIAGLCETPATCSNMQQNSSWV